MFPDARYSSEPRPCRIFQAAMNSANPLNVVPDQPGERLGFLLPIYGEGIRPDGEVEFVLTELSAENIQNFLALMDDIADYNTQLPGRTKLTFENARARYCKEVEPDANPADHGPSISMLQKWTRCALKAARQSSKGQWIGTHVRKQFTHVSPQEAICHVTKDQVSWETAPGRSGGRLYTGALDKTLLLESLMSVAPAGAVSTLFQQLIAEDVTQGVKVLEQGARPQFGQQPEQALLKHLDRNILAHLQAHSNPAVRRRTLRALGQL